MIGNHFYPMFFSFKLSCNVVIHLWILCQFFVLFTNEITAFSENFCCSRFVIYVVFFFSKIAKSASIHSLYGNINTSSLHVWTEINVCLRFYSISTRSRSYHGGQSTQHLTVTILVIVNFSALLFRLIGRNKWQLDSKINRVGEMCVQSGYGTSVYDKSVRLVKGILNNLLFFTFHDFCLSFGHYVLI